MKINYYVKVKVEKLERRFTILTGKKLNLIIHLQKVWNISLESTGDPEQGNLHKIDSINKGTKMLDLEAPLEPDPFKIFPIVMQKNKRYKIDQ